MTLDEFVRRAQVLGGVPTVDATLRVTQVTLRALAKLMSPAAATRFAARVPEPLRGDLAGRGRIGPIDLDDFYREVAVELGVRVDEARAWVAGVLGALGARTPTAA